MTAGGNRTGPFAHGGEGWRVRVRSRESPGVVLGAGVLLDRDLVLTCAHVALAADGLVVDMVGLPGSPSTDAWIVDGLCVPPAEGERGDVAVLRLDERQPRRIGATLRRAALTWDRPVHALGYPQGRGLEIGVWSRMTLAGWAGTEWLQMNRRSEGEQRIRAGFSGAGVADDATGEVLGIVVSEYTDEAAGLSWMLPVEAIVRHIPLTSEYVVGDSGIDPIFRHSRPQDTGRVRELMDWLARRGDGGAVLILVGDDVTAVRHAIALSTVAMAEPAAPDIALDVSGRTVEEVSRRIMDRAGLAPDGATTSSRRVRAGTPPMTVVLDGVDKAEQPHELFEDVVKPLADSGARVVLGFRQDDSADLAAARALAADVVRARLDAFGPRIAALVDARGPDDRASRLRLQLSALRMAAAQDHALVADRLGDFERRVVGAERAARAAERRAAAVSDLRGQLEAWKAMAGDGGLVEHLGIAAAYREAYGLLRSHPVDLEAARAAVEAYQAAVRGAISEGERG